MGNVLKEAILGERWSTQMLLASVFAVNLCMWTQEVARSWQVLDAGGTALEVSLLQAAPMTAVLLFSIPAGIVADLLDPRRVLVLASAIAFFTAIVVASATASGLATPKTLIIFSFFAAIGVTFIGPAWQSSMALIAREERLESVTRASARLFNLARSIGPAIGGLAIALLEPAWIHVISGMGAAMLGVTAFFRIPASNAEKRSPQRAFSALKDVTRYLAASMNFQNFIVKTLLFALPGSALWALLPLVGSWNGDARTYGVTLILVATGALAGSMLVPLIERALGRPAAASILALAVSFTLVGLAWLDAASRPWILPVGGFGWIGSMTLLMTASQAGVPAWMRGRAIAMFLVVLSLGMATGSTLWGLHAQHFGTDAALLASGTITALGALVSFLIRTPIPTGQASTPEMHEWTIPAVLGGAKSTDKKSIVMVEYRVHPDRVGAFYQAMRDLEPLRRIEGSSRWSLVRSATDDYTFMEINTLDAWEDHVRQRHRGTTASVDAERRVREALQESSRVDVRYWFVEEE